MSIMPLLDDRFGADSSNFGKAASGRARRYATVPLTCPRHSVRFFKFLEHLQRCFDAVLRYEQHSALHADANTTTAAGISAPSSAILATSASDCIE
jgi:hypothetical protein